MTTAKLCHEWIAFRFEWVMMKIYSTVLDSLRPRVYFSFYRHINRLTPLLANLSNAIFTRDVLVYRACLRQIALQVSLMLVLNSLWKHLIFVENHYLIVNLIFFGCVSFKWWWPMVCFLWQNINAYCFVGLSKVVVKRSYCIWRFIFSEVLRMSVMDFEIILCLNYFRFM